MRTFLKTKFFETFVTYRKLSSNNVSWCYNDCVPRLQTKILWEKLQKHLKPFSFCSSIKQFGKELEILRVSSRTTMGVVARSAFHVSQKTLEARTYRLISVKFVYLGAQTFQLVMTKMLFTCAEDHFERNMTKLLINFSRFCLEIVGQCCVVIKFTFSGFCEGRISWKKCVSSELWVQKHRPLLSKTRVTCAGFFGAKTRSKKR